MTYYTNRKHEYRKNRLDIIKFLGGKCIQCGFNDPRALQIDHVNGNGVVELRAISTSLYYRIIKENTTGDYQLLCANCNWIKRSINNENPKIKSKQITYTQPILTKIEREPDKFCKRGHEKTESSTYNHHGTAECLICKRIADKQFRHINSLFKKL